MLLRELTLIALNHFFLFFQLSRTLIQLIVLLVKLPLASKNFFASRTVLSFIAFVIFLQQITGNLRIAFK